MILACALTWDETRNLGLLGWHCSQWSCPASGEHCILDALTMGACRAVWPMKSVVIAPEFNCYKYTWYSRFLISAFVLDWSLSHQEAARFVLFQGRILFHEVTGCLNIPSESKACFLLCRVAPLDWMSALLCILSVFKRVLHFEMQIQPPQIPLLRSFSLWVEKR